MAFLDVHSFETIRFMEEVNGNNEKPEIVSLTAMPLFVDKLRRDDLLNDNLETVVAAPDFGSFAKARELSMKLRKPLIFIDKERPRPHEIFIKGLYLIHSDGKVEKIDNESAYLKDKRVIFFDDSIDTGETSILISQEVKKRGAKQAIFTATHAIFSDPIETDNPIKTIQQALDASGLPRGAVSLIPVAERAGVDAMLELDDCIDVVIPRGGEELIRKITRQSRIPVIKHAKGVCHVFVDEAADLAMAQAIAFNAKCQRPATCNAMETLLVHERIAKAFLPKMVTQFRQARVELRGCEATRVIVPDVHPATEEDWSTEYLDLILSVRVVGSLDDAIDHIKHYGSAHSDTIVTNARAHADRFLQEVDSACVYVNASTRFTDGYQFGLGAEIGISTDRLHARGPMGLEELTTYKYVVIGTGQIRE